MRITVRGDFVALTLAVLAHALTLAATLVWWNAQSRTEALERVLRDHARSLSQAVDRDIRAAISALETLRHSAPLVAGDIGAFSEVARRVHADNPHWLTIALNGRDGQQVMNLAAEPGPARPNVGDYEVLQAALAGRPAVSALFVGRVRNVPLISIQVPVTIDGEVRYTLATSLSAGHFQSALDSHPISAGWITGIVDQKGIVIARSLGPEEAVGTPAATMWTGPAEPEGMVRGVGRLAVPVVGAYARSELTGWTSIVSLRESGFNRPRNGALLALGLGGSVVLGTALLIALYLGRRVVRPIQRLARHADSIVRGEMKPYVGASPLVEANRLAEALQRAGQKQREAEQSLKESREQLFQAQKMEAVGQLTGGIAHDFNNLLTIVIGNLDRSKRVLADWKDGAHERLMRLLDSATQGAQRAAVLTSQLLAFSRRQPLSPQSLDVNRLISHLQELLRPSLGETIQIEAVAPADAWPIEADPVQLEAAIVNLAVNARDAMPNGGILSIEAANVVLDEHYCASHPETKPGEYVAIAVTDSGTGMTAEVAERAFEPFFTTKQNVGTGLGLSQVYGFAKQSGGHVGINSKPGRGTTIRLYLPRAHAAKADEPSTPPEHHAGGSETVLVVEDDAAVRTFVAETLQELGYTIIQAGDAETALRALDAKTVDLLLTDVILPGANGRELSLAVAERHPGTRVLFMTGYSRDTIVHDGRLDPGVELIQKPLTEASLGAKVRSVLDRPAIG